MNIYYPQKYIRWDYKMVPIHQETKLKKNKLFVFLLWGKQRLVSSHKDKDFASMNGK